MARTAATTKVVLFTRVTVDKSVHLWPTGIFSSDRDAKAYVTALRAAHESGDAVTAKALDPETRIAEDGTLIKGVKFSLRIVSYNPALPEPEASPVEISDSGSL